MWKRVLSSFGSIIAILVLSLAATPTATAARGGSGNGGGGGGGGGQETTTNSLSVPVVFVGGSAGFGLTNPALQPPTGDPSAGWDVDPAAYYYVQGVNRWQAEYVVQNTDTATAKWGDNIAGGEASFKVGSPIRVEMGLTSTDVTSLQGYSVVKLQPGELDRNSAYGTRAIANGDGTFSATAQIMAARVWGPGATLTITGPANATASMPGEINATGAIVYGYNWRPSAAGTYTLSFNPPSGVTVADTSSLSVQVVVAAGSGSRGGGGGGRP